MRINKKILFIFTIVIILFNCKSSDSIDTADIADGINDFKSAEYELYTPALDQEKYAPTHKFIYIEIQNKQYPFIVDTGDRNGNLKVSFKLAEELNAIKTGSSSESKNFYGKLKENECLISGVEIGNIEFNNLKCDIVDDSWFWPWNTVDESIGIIGWGLLKEFNLFFNYKENKLIFYNKGIIPGNIKNWDNIGLYISNNMLGIKAKIENSKKESKFLIDSGAGNYSVDESGNSIFLDSLFSKYHGKYISDDNRKSKLYLDSSKENLVYTMDKIYFGMAEAPWFITFKYTGILGWNFFRQYTLFFDNANNMLYFK